MFLLNNILGGQGLNSRLNLSLREKNGLAYNVESSYNPYSDTGIFSIYFGTDSQYLEKSISIAMAELKKLRTSKLGIIQLSKAKNQIKGYLARGYENHESLMLSLGKSLLVFNKIDTIEEICRKIDIITASELLEIANDIFEPSKIVNSVFINRWKSEIGVMDTLLRLLTIYLKHDRKLDQYHSPTHPEDPVLEDLYRQTI